MICIDSAKQLYKQVSFMVKYFLNNWSMKESAQVLDSHPQSCNCSNSDFPGPDVFQQFSVFVFQYFLNKILTYTETKFKTYRNCTFKNEKKNYDQSFDIQASGLLQAQLKPYKYIRFQIINTKRKGKEKTKYTAWLWDFHYYFFFPFFQIVDIQMPLFLASAIARKKC